jgi:hypothetical protein
VSSCVGFYLYMCASVCECVRARMYVCVCVLHVGWKGVHVDTGWYFKNIFTISF